MLPYTIYQVPESVKNEVDPRAHWLWMLFGKPLSDAEKDLVLKSAAALKADYAEDVFSIICEPGQTNSIPSVAGQQPKVILSFGVPPSRIGIWIDLHKPGLITLEHTTFLLTLPVEALAGNASAKKELWRHMQLILETA